MRKLRAIMILCTCVCVLGGCDLFRKMAGRPTSEEIEAKRARIEAERTAHEDRLGMLDSVHRQISDSLAILDSIKLSNSSLVAVRQLAEDSRNSLTHRYYVIVGTFGKRDNAGRQAARAEEAGYATTLIGYKNGFTAVGICPADRLAEAYASLRLVRDGGFCADAWILDNR